VFAESKMYYSGEERPSPLQLHRGHVLRPGLYDGRKNPKRDKRLIEVKS